MNKEDFTKSTKEYGSFDYNNSSFKLSWQLVCFWTYLIILNIIMIILSSDIQSNIIIKLGFITLLSINLFILIVLLIIIAYVKESKNKILFFILKHYTFFQIFIFHYLLFNFNDNEKFYSKNILLFLNTSLLLTHLSFLFLFKLVYKGRDLFISLLILQIVSILLSIISLLFQDYQYETIIKLVINELIRVLVLFFIYQLYFIFSRYHYLKDQISVNSILISSLDLIISNTRTSLMIISSDNISNKVIYEKNFSYLKKSVENSKPQNESGINEISIQDKLLLKSNNNLNNITSSFKINKKQLFNSDLKVNQDYKKTMDISTLIEKKLFSSIKVISNNAPINKYTHVNIEDSQINNDKISHSKVNISQIGLNSSICSKKSNFANKQIEGLTKDFKIKLIENHDYQLDMLNPKYKSIINKIESNIHKGIYYSEILNLILKISDLSEGELGPFKSENLRDQLVFTIKFKKVLEEISSYYLFIIKEIALESPSSMITKIDSFNKINIKCKNNSTIKNSPIMNSCMQRSNSTRQKFNKKSIYSDISEKIEDENEQNLNEYSDDMFDIDKAQTSDNHMLAALLHDFKNAIFDFSCNVKLIVGKFPVESKNSFKEDLCFLDFSEGYIYSLIKFLNDFLQKNEFLANLDVSEINLISLINKIVHIFNKRIEYENSNKGPNQKIKDITILSKINDECDLDSMKGLSKYNENLVISLLYNIVSNSYKYTTKGEICLELKKEMWNNSMSLLLLIKDTGCGINEKTLRNWGKPYNNVDKTKGTGLGQFIIEKIAISLGIFIPNPESVENVGTTYKIYFPLSNQETEVYQEERSTVTVKKEWLTQNELLMDNNFFSDNLIIVKEQEEKEDNIYILCLDDCQQILDCFDNYAKKNLICNNYNFIIKKASNYFEFMNEINRLLEKNHTFDFLILDHNLDKGNITGLDCAFIVIDIYKRIFPEFRQEKFKVIFLTEENNFYQSYKQYDLVCKERIFGKTEFKKVIGVILELINN